MDSIHLSIYAPMPYLIIERKTYKVVMIKAKLYFWSSIDHFLRRLSFKLSKVLFEAHCQILVASIVFLFIMAGRRWDQHIVGDIWAMLRDLEAKDRIVGIGYLIELSC